MVLNYSTYEEIAYCQQYVQLENTFHYQQNDLSCGCPSNSFSICELSLLSCFKLERMYHRSTHLVS